MWPGCGEIEAPKYTKNQVVNGDFNRDIVDNMNTNPDNWFVWAGEGGAVGEYGVKNGKLKQRNANIPFDALLNAADIPKLIFFLGNTENADATTVYIDHVVLEKIN